MAEVVRAARARAREEVVAAVKEAARGQLAATGAPGLSLRAVARELGMASSAVYRYVPSRDALLTLLLVDAFDDLGAAVEESEAAVPRADLAGRFRAAAGAVRAWGRAHPHEYALLYGTPVPGYAAPEDTVGPGSRVTRVLSDVLVDGAARPGGAEVPGGAAPGASAAVPGAVRTALAPLRAFVGAPVPDGVLARGLMAWQHLVGAVAFEVFGQWGGVLADGPDAADAFFAFTVDRLVELVGLEGAAR